LASLLHRSRETEVNQTLQGVLFIRLLGCYTTYTLWGLLPRKGILPGAKFTLGPCLALSCIGIVKTHSNRALGVNEQAFFRVFYIGVDARLRLSTSVDGRRCARCEWAFTAQHSSSRRQPNFAAWYLHATERPSRSTLGGRTV